MKHIIILILAVFSFTNLKAEDKGKDIATDTFKVEGNCEMCKKRIENAAYIKGVKRADWNKETHELVIIYRPSKTSAEAILKSVAKAGHNSELATANEADYESLPKCCHYKTEECEH